MREGREGSEDGGRGGREEVTDLPAPFRPVCVSLSIGRTCKGAGIVAGITDLTSYHNNKQQLGLRAHLDFARLGRSLSSPCYLVGQRK